MSKNTAEKNATENTASTTPDVNKTTIVPFGEVEVGDYVFDEHGNPVRVSSVNERHVPKRMFVVEDKDGNAIKVSGTHLWYVVTDYDLEHHHARLQQAKKVLAPLTKSTIVYNRLVSFAENYYKENYPLEIPVLDMVALLFDENDVDVYDPTVAEVYATVQRIADSVGMVSQETTTVQDLAFSDEQESVVEPFYDARLM